VRRREQATRGRSSAPAPAASVIAALALVTLPAARAARAAPETADASAAPPAAASAPPRPRLSAAVGFGWSFDPTGFTSRQDVPSMFATGGVGADWPVGVELGAFGSSAVGRYAPPATPIDRLALDAFGVVRPFAWWLAAGDERTGARVLRALGAEVGLGLERDGTTVQAGSRFGLHLGARVEVPLTRKGPTELALRLALRAFEGFYTPRVGALDVGNTVELFSALVTTF